MLQISFPCMWKFDFYILTEDAPFNPCLFLFQNLREAIATYRNSILRQPDEMKREASLSFFVEYLERYYFLICFTVYIHSEMAALQATSAASHTSFADWMRARPELYSIIRRLLLFSLPIIGVQSMFFVLFFEIIIFLIKISFH
jgi:hypothetical protein